MDDIILQERQSNIQQVKDQLSSQFSIKDLGKLRFFLGINVFQDEEKESVWTGQPIPIYAETCEMHDAKSVSTPVNCSTKLEPATDEDVPVNQIRYESAVESLMYLAVSTRPDNVFA